MNPYPARIAELHEFLDRVYGVQDRLLVDLMLSVCLADGEGGGVESTTANGTCGGVGVGKRKPWVILETDYPNRDLSDAWFTFGREEPGKERAVHLSGVRTLRPAATEKIIAGWLRERRERARVFVDSEWRKSTEPVHRRGYRSYGAFLSQCVRVKAVHPKNERMLKTESERDRDRAELRRLAGRVLDCGFRSLPLPSDAMKIHAPKSLLYWCELCQKVSGVHGVCGDWDCWVGTVMDLVRQRSYLYAGEGMGESVSVGGWGVAERLLWDSVPWITGWILERAGKDQKSARAAWEMWRKSGERLDRPFVAEMRRLHETGILRVRKDLKVTPGNPYRYWLADADVRRLVNRQPLFPPTITC